MDLHRAHEILGVSASSSAAEVRSAYRRLLREHHPDVVGATGTSAARDAREIIEAYRVVRDSARPAVASPPTPQPPPPSSPAPPRARPDASPRTGRGPSARAAPGATARPGTGPGPTGRRWGTPRWSPGGRPSDRPAPPSRAGWKPPAWLSSPDTLSLAAPADEALPYLIELAHRFGEVTYLDAENGLFETVIRTTTGATLSLVVTLQGRGIGSTEAFFTVEPMHAPRGAALITAHDIAAAFAEELNGKTQG